MRLLISLIGAFVLVYSVKAVPCEFDHQCTSLEHCQANNCRLGYCNEFNTCQSTETCRDNPKYPGVKSCYANEPQHTEPENEDCPGGTAVLIGGIPRSCNAFNPCPYNELCNPLKGVCCSGLRICQNPYSPEIDSLTKKPKMCRSGAKETDVIPNACTEGKAFCEPLTGFCCKFPSMGKPCSTTVGCGMDNAECRCDANKQNCQCQCLTSFGYTLSDDGKQCVRARRRLEERCEAAAQCRSAFADCINGRCKCRSGFVYDSKDGCRPQVYRCGATNAVPLTLNNQVVICDLSLDMSKLTQHAYSDAVTPQNKQTVNELLSDTTFVEYIFFRYYVTNKEARNEFHTLRYKECTLSKERYMTDSCTSGYYCVPFYDFPDGPQHYKGICCPSPQSVPEPKCPVGVAHESSLAPDYGCSECPAFGYFCHRDTKMTPLEVCCPTPCPHPGDIYIDGQCYPVASFGESCEISEQCIGSRSQTTASNDLQSLISLGVTDELGTKMSCVNKKCDCERGFIDVNSRCIRATCTIGQMSEPMSDSTGATARCDVQSTSGDCPQGYACDPTFSVCCKQFHQQNRCPQGYLETGHTCWGTGYGCNQVGWFCHFANWPPTAGAEGVCCMADPAQTQNWG